MLLYSSVGAADLDKALAFYDKVLQPLGGKRGELALDRFVTFTGADGALFAVCKPFDQKPCAPGNGTTVAFAAPDRATVDAVHKAALDNGGSDEGAPGERMPGLYAGYFRDLDGNKIACIKLG